METDQNVNETENNVQENSELSLVERAEAAAKRIEDANKNQIELIERMEKAKAKELLGGKSEAGIIPEPVKEETPAEYAKRVLGGTI